MRAVRRDKMRPQRARNMRAMKFALYFSNAPAPKTVAREIGRRCEPILQLFRR